MSRPDAQPNGPDYRSIFLNDIPLIDTRAPIEFERGAFPTSVSLPLMTNEERAQVGTCYKQQGQAAAIELGHQLVIGEVKSQRVNAWIDFARHHPQGYLYCWRGGLRSQICQQWMHEAGCDYPRIGGGYKAMRRYLIDEFERICTRQPLLILGGRTGCNKTALIEELPQAVDLEALAHHRGSSFGRRPGGQPTQLNFENGLAVAMLKAEHQALSRNLSILLEDESRLVGRCALPPVLQQVMGQSPIVLLEVSLEERVEHSYRNYILNKQLEWQQRLGEEDGFDAFAEDLSQSLYRVRKRLGGVRYREINDQLENALVAHRTGKPDLHRDWITQLLVDYYDPMYDYQLSKKSELIVYRGDRAAVREYLSSHKRSADGSTSSTLASQGSGS
ncbi:tRNA 2-selenouridine(34) synthase MnmH [Hahella sp. CCB-MM4]|uniref:tRNA 2-selenouridine(34) synthase MnmH n=1 Tax=Hahella sp. (strain CCB-MM4) TaxID=1926491 RepID=UPI000B9C3501|nr:tRNA 2-selenouridine(34) synthase MnmH [Hahella sp. CCB-MM4]OZG70010.1 tRNA 2-selenouridine(34) synthase MnmH [Hahella sp. CCB-MM4]